MRWHAPVFFLVPKNSESSAARQQKNTRGLELPKYKREIQHSIKLMSVTKNMLGIMIARCTGGTIGSYRVASGRQSMADLRHAIAAAALFSSEGVHAAAVNGYLRVPAVYQSQSGGAVCFKLPGAETKYRLGNECEMYGELQLTEGVTTLQDGAALKGMQWAVGISRARALVRFIEAPYALGGALQMIYRGRGGRGIAFTDRQRGGAARGEVAREAHMIHVTGRGDAAGRGSLIYTAVAIGQRKITGRVDAADTLRRRRGLPRCFAETEVTSREAEQNEQGG